MPIESEATERRALLGNPAADGRDWVVIDSNIFKPGSTWEITATPADGGSRVAVTMVREFKGLKGRLVGAIMIRTGLAKRTMAGHLRHFLAELEGQGLGAP